MMITVKLAGLAIGIDNKYEYLVRQTKDYLTDESAVFTVSVTEEEIDAENDALGGVYRRGYLESIAVYRKIAERLPLYDAFVFHGAVLNVGGTAYAFTAKSGVGKTTHIRLWLEELAGCAHILNGDKPIIRFIDGIPYACGTPWRGKEDYGVNEMAPLGGIAFLSRSEKNIATVADPAGSVMKLITQMYMPTDRSAVARTMVLADRLLRGVRLIDLGCNMNSDAPRVAYEALLQQDAREGQK